MIVVSAATGEFGRLVMDRLLALLPSDDLAVAVRNPRKAADLAERGVDVRYGDYDQPDSLRPAFDGADRLLFISSPLGDLSGGRVAQHRAVVAAAREARVGHIAYTSGLGADMVDEGVLLGSTISLSRQSWKAASPTPCFAIPSTPTSSSTPTCGQLWRPAS